MVMMFAWIVMAKLRIIKMIDAIKKLRLARDVGERVILEQSEVIELLATIEEKQTLPERVKDFVNDNNIHLNEHGKRPLLFFPEITLK